MWSDISDAIENADALSDKLAADDVDVCKTESDVAITGLHALPNHVTRACDCL